ncbi:MAG: copper-binding protein [Rhodoferax sp.]
MKKFFSVGVLLAATAAAFAQAPAADMTEAEIRKVDLSARKVTLRHGPIKNLDMPPMTMVFQVRDVKQIEPLKAGDKVRFRAEQQQGTYVVTEIEKVKP